MIKSAGEHWFARRSHGSGGAPAEPGTGWSAPNILAIAAELPDRRTMDRAGRDTSQRWCAGAVLVWRIMTFMPRAALSHIRVATNTDRAVVARGQPRLPDHGLLPPGATGPQFGTVCRVAQPLDEIKERDALECQGGRCEDFEKARASPAALTALGIAARPGHPTSAAGVMARAAGAADQDHQRPIASSTGAIPWSSPAAAPGGSHASTRPVPSHSPDSNCRRNCLRGGGRLRPGRASGPGQMLRTRGAANMVPARRIGRCLMRSGPGHDAQPECPRVAVSSVVAGGQDPDRDDPCVACGGAVAAVSFADLVQGVPCRHRHRGCFRDRERALLQGAALVELKAGR
jgi:hypothetical protein